MSRAPSPIAWLACTALAGLLGGCLAPVEAAPLQQPVQLLLQNQGPLALPVQVLLVSDDDAHPVFEGDLAPGEGLQVPASAAATPLAVRIVAGGQESGRLLEPCEGRWAAITLHPFRDYPSIVQIDIRAGCGGPA